MGRSTTGSGERVSEIARKILLFIGLDHVFSWRVDLHQIQTL